MQGHGSRGGHGGGDPGHRGGGGLFIKKGAGGRPSKAAIAAKTAASDVTQTRISFGAALAQGGKLEFEGRIVLEAPPTFEEAAAVAGREYVVAQQKSASKSSRARSSLGRTSSRSSWRSSTPCRATRR